MSGPGERFLEEYTVAHGWLDYDAAADALAAVGLVSPEAAERWKAEHVRFRAALGNREGPYDPEIEARADELLESLFEAVRPRSSADWDPLSYQRFFQALHTLTGIGALSVDRTRPWLQRHREIVDSDASQPPREPDPEMPFVAGELRAVLTGPETRVDGLRVVSVELYDDCVLVRHHPLLPAEPEDPVERRELLDARFELEDDRGTPYQPAHIPLGRGCRPRKIDGWPAVRAGWQAFLPAAPVDVRELVVTWREARFAVPNPLPDRHSAL